MSIEDRIREAMTAHEHEAPGAAEFLAERGSPQTPGRGHTAWFAAAAAACVLAVAVAVAVVVAPRGTQHPIAATRVSSASAPTVPALACPGKSQQQSVFKASDYWVPAQAQGVDAVQRLVPDRTPGRVVVCAYLQGRALTGSKVLRGDLAQVTASLTWSPRSRLRALPCTTELRKTDADAYLIGLSYPGGTIWVAAPGDHCDGASNGQFTTDSSAAIHASSWYKSGLATGPPDLPCDAVGRIGQERAMVPAIPTSLTICYWAVGEIGHVSIKSVATGFGALIRALNALATAPWTGGCGPTTRDGSYGESYHLIFRYAAGEPVEVELGPQCPPSVNNGWLQSDDSSTIVPLVRQLLARR